ncbi:hypothetical protein BC830DRAFT_254730 [Chytriomyces sp. MP71]|nr:hypothetical protein BC830DRAFT_254730 [Chytriomyces sp. MP71]
MRFLARPWAFSILRTLRNFATFAPFVASVIDAIEPKKATQPCSWSRGFALISFAFTTAPFHPSPTSQTPCTAKASASPSNFACRPINVQKDASDRYLATPVRQAEVVTNAWRRELVGARVECHEGRRL